MGQAKFDVSLELIRDALGMPDNCTIQLIRTDKFGRLGECTFYVDCPDLPNETPFDHAWPEILPHVIKTFDEHQAEIISWSWDAPESSERVVISPESDLKCV